MGPHRAAALSLLFCAPALAQSPGWGFSPLPGEGDRAAMGCDRAARPDDFFCVVVRCEDDFSPGLHLYTSRVSGALGRWVLTLDREERQIEIAEVVPPYSGRIVAADGWLLERIRQGAYIYLRHAQDDEAPFRFISLSGSLLAIEEALYWCAPRLPPSEQNVLPGVATELETGEDP